MAAIGNFIDVRGISYNGKEFQDIFAKDIYSLDLRNYGITLMDPTLTQSPGVPLQVNAFTPSIP